MKKGKKSVKPLTDEQRRLVEKEIPFAKRLAESYAELGQYWGVPLEDLQGEAYLALCLASQRFEGRNHADFQTFAYDWCRKYILLAIQGEPLSDSDVEDLEGIDTADDVEAAVLAADCAERVEALLKLLDKKEREVVCLIHGLPYSWKVKNSLPKDFREVARILGIHSSRVHEIYEQALGKMEVSPLTPKGE